MESTTESITQIKATVIEICDTLRKLRLSEKYQPILIAGILLALEDNDFNKELSNFTTFDEIFTALNFAMQRTLSRNKVSQDKIKYIADFLAIILKNQKSQNLSNEQETLLWCINEINQKIKPITSSPTYNIDVLSLFYQNFVGHSDTNSKNLGIVLTPSHLVDFICEVAGVSPSTKVLDLCCGSGAFLIGASSSGAGKLFGIELDIELYLLALTNLILKHQNTSQLFYGDCFNSSIKNLLQKQNIDVGLINPPYAQADHCELEFVENLLSVLRVGGLGVAIVPMSSAIGTKFKEVRNHLMEYHTLKAVFSMPDQIFYPAGINVCVMVWQAHIPHQRDQPTFFGYYKNDGFIKHKKFGRIDAKNSWKEIKQKWLKLYREQIIQPGLSTLRPVGANDEWLCEAYMETDYSTLTKKDFEKTVRDYLAYLIKNGIESSET